MKISRIFLDAVLPAVLVLTTIVWTAMAGTVPREWAYPALLVAGTLSGDLVVRWVFNLADVSSERPSPGPNPWSSQEPPAEPVTPPLRGGLVKKLEPQESTGNRMVVGYLLNYRVRR